MVEIVEPVGTEHVCDARAPGNIVRADIEQSRTLKAARKGKLELIVGALAGIAGFVGAVAGLDRVAQMILVGTACVCGLLAFRKFVLVGRYRRQDHKRGVR